MFSTRCFSASYFHFTHYSRPIACFPGTWKQPNSISNLSYQFFQSQVEGTVNFATLTESVQRVLDFWRLCLPRVPKNSVASLRLMFPNISGPRYSCQDSYGLTLNWPTSFPSRPLGRTQPCLFIVLSMYQACSYFWTLGGDAFQMHHLQGILFHYLWLFCSNLLCINFGVRWI